jgi:tetratricopeptide (TPR) repeat protein
MQNDLLFLSLNGFISFVLAILLCYVLPKNLQRPRLAIVLLFFIFSAFMPVIGAIFLVLLTVLSYWFVRERPGRFISVIERPIFLREKVTKPIDYGEGGAWMRMRSDSTLTSSRLQAMAAVNFANVALVNRLNSEMLHENSDELRLFAFSLLNEKAVRLDKWISENQKILKQQELSQLERASVEKRLAFLYWELVYQHLVQDDLLNYMLSKALQYALSAIEQLHEDLGLWVLLGKIYYRNRDEKQAVEAFSMALQLRAPYENVLPYLAAINFKHRDYSQLKATLSMGKTLTDVPRLREAVRFWSEA